MRKFLPYLLFSPVADTVFLVPLRGFPVRGPKLAATTLFAAFDLSTRRFLKLGFTGRAAVQRVKLESLQ